MDLQEARGILLIAATAWAVEQLAYERNKFKTRPYAVQKLVPVPDEDTDSEQALKIRAEVFDTAVLQCAREVARAGAGKSSPR